MKLINVVDLKPGDYCGCQYRHTKTVVLKEESDVHLKSAWWDDVIEGD